MAQPIDYTDIERLKSNYQTKPPIFNTVSGWISIYELMALISDNKANGVRFYLSRHDEDDPTYPDQNTVVFVATLDSTNPGNPSTKYSKDLIDVKASVASDGSYTGMGSDMIPLCPPNCSQP
ncbi:hypothetical protein [Mucilaginibacter psychrotolerans]|uniref:Uncharacterized protein n=1 Tax=Mucilaginibacter psychrotolerans TaxID=1524096 RepID=A0A4Y8S304_9SPHI|nr:hypothetical protein [Mucilaginibacter psychrotolerans]TFF33373.1 hypothetical protein E2R66_26305 [Mucilaginibacter psychrotolerans]